jgi:RNA polymerase sigma factor (sigma-70 family)
MSAGESFWMLGHNMLDPIDNERALVAGLRKGDPDAQGQLLGLYGEPLIRFLVVVCRADLVEAEDLAVEALYRAIEHIENFAEKPTSGPHGFRNWLFTIARNLWRDHVRHESRIANTSVEDLAPLAPRLPSIESDDLSPTVQAVQEALAKLPDSQRLTLVLHYNGLQLKEVAEILGVKPGTARQWKRRGLAALAKTLIGNPALSYLVEQEATIEGKAP